MHGEGGGNRGTSGMICDSAFLGLGVTKVEVRLGEVADVPCTVRWTPLLLQGHKPAMALGVGVLQK